MVANKTVGSLVNARGQKLHTVEWLPEEVKDTKACIFFQHGFGEYIERFDAVFQTWTSAGIAVYGFDTHGMGLSEPLDVPQRALVRKFAFLVEDSLKVLKDVVQPSLKANNITAPLFIAGNSLGGLVASYVVLASPDTFAGLVMQSPAIDVEWTPVLSSPRPRPPSSPPRLRPRLPSACPQALKEHLKHVGSTDVTLHEVAGGYHELLYGPEKEEVKALISAWVLAKAAAAAAAAREVPAAAVEETPAVPAAAVEETPAAAAPEEEVTVAAAVKQEVAAVASAVAGVVEPAVEAVKAAPAAVAAVVAGAVEPAAAAVEPAAAAAKVEAPAEAVEAAAK
ncbi:Monoglyceride lipase [Tetrabaena socialis]|uniref:Monoglyceride lipase n=1 Tax=Tetrabaena socialis TaxID=47790 RepID=A0A2J8A5Q7_9CHLO|nr:Monoglyceride lipase [Tetrabaena socialis]|eukprot:PNH07837.1 Monoglyceride lipase [Tetrabaena socialis]